MPTRSTLLLAVAAVAAGGASEAHAAADIERVWSFDGGQVAVQRLPDGTFRGTVVRPTRFANCPHAIGERMWTGVRAQGDGSYHGGHQWYAVTSCAPIPRRGNSAFRVLTGPDGGRFLRVCFSRPETPDVQPEIAPDGTSTNVNNACYDSALLRGVPTGRPRLRQVARLPRAGGQCRVRRSIVVHVRHPRADAVRRAVVSVDGRRAGVRRGARVTAPLRLTHLPRGRYTVRVRAVTVLGRRVAGARTYRTCTRAQRIVRAQRPSG